MLTLPCCLVVVIDLKRNTFCHVSQLEQLLMGAHLYPTGLRNIYQEVLRHPSVTLEMPFCMLPSCNLSLHTIEKILLYVVRSLGSVRRQI